MTGQRIKTEELRKMEGSGELSRDYGFDITVSGGGLVTSALNHRDYRSECGKLYQQFMLTMADYIFEEEQIKKRLKSLLRQKKEQQRNSDSAQTADDAVSPEEEDLCRDEDAFTTSQMEEFRRLASSKADNRTFIAKSGFVTQLGTKRPSTSIPIRAPPPRSSGRTDTPHMFRALKERPLTQSSCTTQPRSDTKLGSAAQPAHSKRSATQPAHTKRFATQSAHSKDRKLISGAMLYGGRDQDCDGAMDPSSDFSTYRRMRMNPRAFYKLSSSNRITVTVKDKAGEFVMKPVAGRHGVVTLHHDKHKKGKEHSDARYHLRDSKDKLALIKTITSFTSPTLSSELKTNNLVAIQKSLVGKEAKRMTVGEVMAKSRDRRARLFRVQMSTGRLDDWHVPGEHLGRTSSRPTPPGDGSNNRSMSRLGKGNPANQDDPRKQSGDVDRARTAPPTRPRGRLPANLTSRTAPEGESLLQTPQQCDQSSSNYSSSTESEEDPTPRISVVKLQMPESPKTCAKSSPISSSHVPAKPAASKGTPRGSISARAVFPVSTINDETSEVKERAHSRLDIEKQRRAEALDLADKECTVQAKHLDTLRESAAIVRRWKEQDHDKETQMSKWRMRMTFAASRRGSLSKILARV